MNILDLKENECISVESEQEAIELCKKFDELGLTWISKLSYIDLIQYHLYKKDTVYIPTNGTYANTGWALKMNYKIYPAKLFLQKTLINGVEHTHYTGESSEVDHYSKRLIDFHTAFNSPVAHTPQIPSKERALLRVALLQEELDELKEAIENNDLVECMDAIIDIMVINEGNVVEFGLQNIKRKLYDHIMDSNLSKLDDNGKPIINGENGVYDPTRPLGKILKSKYFREPNLKQFL